MHTCGKGKGGVGGRGVGWAGAGGWGVGRASVGVPTQNGRVGKGQVVRGQGRLPDGVLGAPAREGWVPGETGPTRGRAWVGKGQARMSMVWHAATSHAPKRKNDHNYMVPHHDTYWTAL